jgi:ADP-ribose pyrophosphatase YjhB (NUDIX family)
VTQESSNTQAQNAVRTTARTTVTPEEYAAYIASLPRVLAGAAALFRDEEGRVLLVEPNYREGWVLPGGTVESESGESPRQGARRETLEEIGLEVELGRLLAVDWTTAPGRPPIVAYVYDGGVLDAAQLSAIKIQEEELMSWRLVPADEVPAHALGHLGPRILAALSALADGTGAVELENGRRTT